jgi:hypothetical protein
MILETVEISKDDFDKVKNNKLKMEDFVGELALKSKWHPCGYGFMRPRVYTENDVYYAEWGHSHTCD